MGKRGKTTFVDTIGIARFTEIIKKLDDSEIAALYCPHHFEKIKKARCKACRKTIYRKKKELAKKARQKVALEPMEQFELMPEIIKFKEYFAGKTKLHDELLALKRMWEVIKKSDLAELSRPALWDLRHILVILEWIRKRKISSYGYKQVLRRFFESQQNPLEKHKKIKAHRKDMRSPNGASREVMHFRPNDITAILGACDTDIERLAIQLHITVKSREGDYGKGSLLGAKWSDINWTDDFYGFQTPTITIFESKTAGGTYWRHCPLNLWFADLGEKLRARYEALDQPDGYICDMDYNAYRKLWEKISERTGLDIKPHDCRRSPSGWLRDLDLPDIAIGQYNALTGEAIGYAGVGWENAEIYFQRYGKMNPKAIYDSKLAFPLELFDGLIVRILQEKAKRAASLVVVKK